MASTTEGNGSLKKNISTVPSMVHPTAEEVLEVVVNIKYHAQYSPHFMPLKFDPEKAF